MLRIDFDEVKGHKFIDVESDLGKLYQNIDHLDYDEQLIVEAVKDELDNSRIKSVGELRNFIHKFSSHK